MNAADVLHREALEAADATRSPELAQLVATSIARCPLGPADVGVAVSATEEGILYLLLASTPETLADIDALARAFVWPSYARARKPAAHLKEGSSFNAAVTEISPAGQVALLAPGAAHEASTRAIQLMLDMRSNRPEGTVSAPRQIGRILRDFEDAVAREDPSVALHLLTEAEATGRLSLTNVGLLQLRVLVASRRWEDALTHVERHRLAVQDLPRAVEHDIIRAAHHRWLEDRVGAGDTAGAIAIYREEVAPQVGDVFRDPRCAASAEARSAWMVRYAASGTAWPDATRAEIMALARPTELEWLGQVAKQAQFVANSSDGLARTLLESREHAAAFAAGEADLAMTVDERAAVLSQAAVPLGDPVRLAVASRAIADVASGTAIDAPPAVVERVSRTELPAVEVHDWASWLRAVFDNPKWSDALQALDAGVEGWSEALQDVVSPPSDLPDLIEALSGEDAFRLAVPRLTRALVPTGPDRGERIRTRSRALEALSYSISRDGASGLADLEAIADIAEALLEAGLDGGGYETLCGQIETTWARVAAPRLSRWLVDVLRILSGSPCPDEERRRETIGALISALASDLARSVPLTPPEVWAEISEVIEGSGLEDLIPASVLTGASPDSTALAVEAFVHLAGTTILLHTLVPKAAERASAYIREFVPSVTVLTDGSHDGSPQLRDRVRAATTTVIASRAAKHAATDFIRQNLSGELLWASGKGWSSLVDALRESPLLA